jgi:hypothetical protein
LYAVGKTIKRCKSSLGLAEKPLLVSLLWPVQLGEE